MMVSSDWAQSRTVSEYSRCNLSNRVSNSKPVMPMTPFMGVRISWLMLARNSLLATDAAIASYEQDLAAAKSKGHKIADDARESAKAKATADRTAVEADLAKKISAAEDRIADIKAKALADVGAIAEETATAVVKQLIGGTVTKAEITAAVKASAGN